MQKAWKLILCNRRRIYPKGSISEQQIELSLPLAPHSVVVTKEMTCFVLRYPFHVTSILDLRLTKGRSVHHNHFMIS